MPTLPRPLRRAIALPAVLLAMALPAAAQDIRQDASFALEIRGINVGMLNFSGVENASSYAVSGTLQSTGLAGMLRRMRYEAKVRGSQSGSNLRPARYEQSGGANNRHSEEVVVWTAGLPRIERQEPPKPARPGDPDPAQQRGTVDTLTALYATLRDVPRGQECTTNVIIYDGRYRMQLRLSAPRAEGETVTCSGEYIRLAGFSAEEMAERTRFGFTVHYAPLPDGRMRVTQVAMDSLYGRARLVRR